MNQSNQSISQTKAARIYSIFYIFYLQVIDKTAVVATLLDRLVSACLFIQRTGATESTICDDSGQGTGILAGDRSSVTGDRSTVGHSTSAAMPSST
jgi:hypothetical protein